jgi:hypothetical protein
MNTMAPSRVAGLQARRARLTPGPAAAAEARRQVREVIEAWDVLVDGDVAVLLTSDLVTHAIRHAVDQAIVLGIRCGGGRLRIDVHDAMPSLPAQAGAPTKAEAAPGLALVARLAHEWGCYKTPAGKVVYFTLACRPEFP